ncbi:MAG: SOS response-associated peptidase [Bacteroidota bacterium]
MCFYYSLNKMSQRYKGRAQNNDALRKMDLVNGFKFPEMPVITESKMDLMHWGLIPFWSKDDTIKKFTLNARAETVFEKPSFKNSIFSKRCIVPATGYFEWKHTGNQKQPWFIRLKNQDSFSFAGIWDKWTDKNTGEIIYSYSIITTAANPLLAEIHNTKKRMPLVLTKDVEFDWLNNHLTKNEIEEFFVPLGQQHFEAYPIKPFDRNIELQKDIATPLQ